MEAVTASFDISPSQLLSTACNGPYNIPSEKVAIPLEANILAISENNQILVIVSVDWFFISPGLRDRILNMSAGCLTETNLIVAASHTHTSPNTDMTKVGFSAVDSRYVAGVEDTIAHRVTELLRSNRWRRVHLRYATVDCDCSIFRRRKIWWRKGSGVGRITTIYPNPAGSRDRNLRLLRVEGEDDSLVAVIWGVSCHPTGWPRVRELSSDYPGGVRQKLRSHSGYEVPVLFLQGFSGDLRPPAVGRWLIHARWHVRLLMFLCSLVNGPFFAGFSPKQYQVWVDGISEYARTALDRAAGTPPLRTKLSVQRTSIPLSAFGLSGETPALTIHSFDLDEQLKVVCISAEVCWEYANLTKRHFPGKTIWPVGYIDSVFGYLPTDSMLLEGGYEVTEFKDSFGIKGDFVPNLEEIIRGALS